MQRSPSRRRHRAVRAPLQRARAQRPLPRRRAPPEPVATTRDAGCAASHRRLPRVPLFCGAAHQGRRRADTRVSAACGSQVIYDGPQQASRISAPNVGRDDPEQRDWLLEPCRQRAPFELAKEWLGVFFARHAQCFVRFGDRPSFAESAHGYVLVIREKRRWRTLCCQ